MKNSKAELSNTSCVAASPLMKLSCCSNVAGSALPFTPKCHHIVNSTYSVQYTFCNCT